MSQFSEDLRELREPRSSLSDDDFVARVMSTCVVDGEAPTQRQLVRWSVWGALATAAALALVVGQYGRAPKPSVAVVARGARHDGLAATVQAFVGKPTLNKTVPLLDGATLSPGDGIVIRYSNPDARSAFLMVLALDARGAVHWLHPAYLDERESPVSLELPAHVSERILPEVAEPEAPEPGPLRVIALLSRTPYDVKSVERRLQRQHVDVPALFPEAEVEEWRCTWRAR